MESPTPLFIAFEEILLYLHACSFVCQGIDTDAVGALRCELAQFRFGERRSGEVRGLTDSEAAMSRLRGESLVQAFAFRDDVNTPYRFELRIDRPSLKTVPFS